MIYATTPTGKTIRYNEGHYIVWGNGHTDIYTEEDGDFVVRIPKDWSVSWNQPGESNNTPELTLSAALLIVSGNIREIDGGNWTSQFRLLKKMKAQLAHFDARGKGWK